MNRTLKHGLFALAALVVVGTVSGGGFVFAQGRAYDASMARLYDVPAPAIARSSDAAVLARGKHVSESIGACSAESCHGPDLGGGKTIDMGPVASLGAPNITGARLATYSDGELARLVKHGIKRDGRSVTFMPVEDFNWISESDLVALVSYLRTVPRVDRADGVAIVKPLGKVLDRAGKLTLDVARRVDHEHVLAAPPPKADAAYGELIARGCRGCHGEHLSGGPIPGAPAGMAVPLNLTPHETGLRGWTYEDFDRLLSKGTRKNGRQLDPLMPQTEYAKLDDTERHALWAYLVTLPPMAFGGR
ncbi:MAG: c-type cytochrome [Polyangiales bacterium]